jgi:secreted trypsin-like serine protease
MRLTMRLAATVAAATLGLALTGTPDAGAVASGAPAADGQFPFAVKLTMTGVQLNGRTYDSACSGALVATSWVITAGHCFHDATGNRVSGTVPYRTTATFGAASTSSPNAVTVAIDVVRQSSSAADVALAHLSSPATAGAPVAISTVRPRSGQILTLAGWGALSSTNPQPQNQLWYGQVKVRSVSTSTASVVGYWPAPNTSACLYDSGAPYVSSGASPRLYSVESNGPSCPHSSPETTARVDNLASWIASVTG